MGRPKKPLKVIPNPFGAIDHTGQPCCAVLCHQGEHVQRGTIRYVGAKISFAEEVRPATEIQIGDIVHQTVSADHEITWEFETEPVEVPDIQYYHEHISRNADLIAADADTARRCGISKFVEPANILADAREKALTEWDSQHGKGDFVEAEQWRKAQANERAKAVAAKASEQATPVPNLATEQAATTRKTTEKGVA